jgi:hypothetical protein
MKSFMPLLIINSFLFGQNTTSILNIDTGLQNEAIITVDSQIHLDYGLSYPVTYEFTIPNNSNNFQASVKFQDNDQWSQMLKKTSEDFFNGIDVVRFDYDENKAYVSIAFSDLSDSIFILITDEYENNVNAIYFGISKYYDNRDAVVTATADDWAGWVNDKFIETCRIFRNYNLWLSCAIVTNVGDPNTWIDIQTQIDSGFIEPISHSRTHPYVPYDDLQGEVLGSKQDLIENLNLSGYNRYLNHEYIYAWVAPYGEYDDNIDTMVSVGKYLVSRMYYGGDHHFSDWNQILFKYDAIGVSTEFGPLWIGTTDTVELNNTFDQVLQQGGVYHVMCHPNIIEWDQDYPLVHLEHISNRNNIWYTGFGHLYLYRFLQSAYQEIILGSNYENDNFLEKFVLYPNYPNPFNPTTTIRYNIPKSSFVNITIYDMMGRNTKTLINQRQNSGSNSAIWDSTNDYNKPVTAGIYLYQIQTGSYINTKKMVLLK